MRIKFAVAMMAAAGLCLIVYGLSMAAVSEPVAKNVTVALRRGSTNVTATVFTEACGKLAGCTLPVPALTVANCDALKTMLIAADGLTRTSGSNVYQCVIAYQSIAKFIPAPVVLPPVDCVVSEWGAWSDPAWLACSGGQQTRALVRYRTILTQPANGGTACPALVETLTETRPCTNTASVSWVAPTQNSDGSALTDLAAYRIVYGTSPAALTQVVQVSPSVTAFVITGLSPGTYYFAVRSVTSTSKESPLSNITSKVIM